jgi:uncharacterized Ntn-hydrolase superfamily protein
MTFSLAARDPQTGMFGISIATSAVAVGNRCPWVRAGVGAVTTQHRTDTRAGPVGIELLTKGFTARETVDFLAANNEFPQERQFAAVDREGRVAFFNGAAIECIHAGHEGHQCVSTGNLLANADVPRRVVEAYEASMHLPFAERLLAAIRGGLDAGGETKPIMASALLIADRHSWPLVDLRVDWKEDPIGELERLWAFYKPYQEHYVNQVIAPHQLDLTQDSPMNL